MNLDELRNRYTGNRASRYEAERAGTSQWRREHEVVADMLRATRLSPADTVLDIPVGTGRFFSIYSDIGSPVLGIDASADMLEIARAAARDHGLSEANLRLGDITNLDLDTDSVEVSVCIRIMNLLDWNDFQAALAGLRRVTRQTIVVGVQPRAPLPIQGCGFRTNLTAARDRLLRRPESSTTTAHPERVVHREFAKQNLEVEERRRVGGSPRVPYYIYRLRVRD